MKKISLIAAISLIGAFGVPLALADTKPVAASGADMGQQSAEPAIVDGYRSARFGMSEAEVRKAIRSDLGVDEAIRGANETERTTVLVVQGKTLIPDTPPATVSYILGATSAKLIQINVVWGETTGADVKQVLPTANSLVSYFIDKGSYAKDSVAVNQPLPDGSVLAFRGSDARGHMVVLHLVPIIDPADVKRQEKDKPVEFKKAALRLSYIANPTKPDVFRIEKGRF
ncbi:MAG: hypothetical protein WCJ64_09620 [Rhodospirillaceae bacterium]